MCSFVEVNALLTLHRSAQGIPSNKISSRHPIQQEKQPWCFLLGEGQRPKCHALLCHYRLAIVWNYEISRSMAKRFREVLARINSCLENLHGSRTSGPQVRLNDLTESDTAPNCFACETVAVSPWPRKNSGADICRARTSRLVWNENGLIAIKKAKRISMSRRLNNNREST